MTKSASLIAPAAASDRFTEIDALRGFALFGILLANLPDFMGLSFAGERAPALIGDVDPQVFNALFNFVLDGKFYTIFSLLFGLGFSLQLDRLDKRGANGRAIFWRRMAVLFAIGICHLSFIWSGDILMLYALIGFTLPLFRPLSDRMLLVVAAILIFAVPFAGVYFINLRNPQWIAPVYDAAMGLYVAAGGDAQTEYFDELAQGGWDSIPRRAASEWLFYIGGKLESWRIPKVLGIMLVGMWAGRRLVAGELLGNRRLLWAVLVAGLAISVPFNLVYAQQQPHEQTHWASLAGTVPAGLAYAAAFLLTAPQLPRVIAALAPVGRMALTNYLATSGIAVIVFYGIGFGMMGHLTVAPVYLGGIALFALMILWSRWWLARHAQGPMEALWRRLTYPSGQRARVATA